jgi:predicted CoA-binding protein
MFANPDTEAICALLRQVKTIAVVGLSPKPMQPSHHIARIWRDLNSICSGS